jgi:hypothetical protein
MKLNNKGFAITGILYTVFALFLMILLSVLSGLNIKRNLLEKNMDTMKEALEEKCTKYKGTDKINISTEYTTKYQGKYVIEVNDYEYTTYLSSNETLTLSTLKDLEYVGSSITGSVSSVYIVEICTTEDIT